MAIEDVLFRKYRLEIYKIKWENITRKWYISILYSISF